MATVHTILAICTEGLLRIGWTGCAVLAVILPLSLYSLGAFTNDEKFQVRGKVRALPG